MDEESGLVVKLDQTEINMVRRKLQSLKLLGLVPVSLTIRKGKLRHGL